MMITVTNCHGHILTFTPEAFALRARRLPHRAGNGAELYAIDGGIWWPAT